jgi:glycosyltransferase involved in cell wall biosynthesis
VHIGDGPLHHDLTHQIVAAGLSDRFRLLGRVDDPRTLISGFDIFAMSSLWEGLPIALLEAMSVGLPAVGTAVSGIEEVIDHRSGMLVPPADSRALANAILQLAADPCLRATLASGAAARSARFAPDLIASQYRQLTRRVLEASDAAAVSRIDPPNVRKASNI